METIPLHTTRQIPWNKGRLTGQKPPLKLNEIWAIRTRLQFTSNDRELAMFNLAIDSKLRACDLTRLRVQDICVGNHVGTRATVMQRKTQRPVQFEITDQTHESVQSWIHARGLKLCDYLFPTLALVTTPFDSTVRADRPSLGCLHRPGRFCLRNAFNPANQSIADLPTHEESACRSTASRTCQA